MGLSSVSLPTPALESSQRKTPTVKRLKVAKLSTPALWRSAGSNTPAQKKTPRSEGPGRGFQLNTEYRLLLNTDFHRLLGFRQAIQNILVGAELVRLGDFWGW